MQLIQRQHLDLYKVNTELKGNVIHDDASGAAHNVMMVHLIVLGLQHVVIDKRDVDLIRFKRKECLC